MEWDNPNANPLEDLHKVAEEMASNTGIIPSKKWEEMTERERKIHLAGLVHGYAQQLYLLGYNGDQVVAELKKLKDMIRSELSKGSDTTGSLSREG